MHITGEAPQLSKRYILLILSIFGYLENIVTGFIRRARGSSEVILTRRQTREFLHVSGWHRAVISLTVQRVEERCIPET